MDDGRCIDTGADFSHPLQCNVCSTLALRCSLVLRMPACSPHGHCRPHLLSSEQSKTSRQHLNAHLSALSTSSSATRCKYLLDLTSTWSFVAMGLLTCPLSCQRHKSKQYVVHTAVLAFIAPVLIDRGQHNTPWPYQLTPIDRSEPFDGLGKPVKTVTSFQTVRRTSLALTALSAAAAKATDHDLWPTQSPPAMNCLC